MTRLTVPPSMPRPAMLYTVTRCHNPHAEVMQEAVQDLRLPSSGSLTCLQLPCPVTHMQWQLVRMPTHIVCTRCTSCACVHIVCMRAHCVHACTLCACVHTTGVHAYTQYMHKGRTRDCAPPAAAALLSWRQRHQAVQHHAQHICHQVMHLMGRIEVRRCCTARREPLQRRHCPAPAG